MVQFLLDCKYVCNFPGIVEEIAAPDFKLMNNISAME